MNGQHSGSVQNTPLFSLMSQEPSSIMPIALEPEPPRFGNDEGVFLSSNVLYCLALPSRWPNSRQARIDREYHEIYGRICTKLAKMLRNHFD